MPSSISVKELHFAKSIEDLQKKAEIPKEDLRKRDYNGLAIIAEKFLTSAKEMHRIGDEEREYFFFFRFLSVQDCVKKEEQKQYINKVTAKKITEVLNIFDSLQENLSKRYDCKQKNHEERKAMLFNSSSSSFPGTSVKVDTSEHNSSVADNDEDIDDNVYPQVKVTDLIEFICSSSSQINKVLIIDIRSSDDFEDSSIAANKIHTKCQLTIINIPCKLIEPSMTTPKLLKKLSFGVTLEALERRRSMDRVVIMDKSTHNFEEDSNCVLLAMALNKWDQSPERIKKKPYLLTGGYVEFVFTYPMYVTRSDNILNNAQSALPYLKTVKTKDLYDFDQENDPEEDRKKANSKTSTTLNGFITPLNNNASANPLSINDRSSAIGSFGFSAKVVPGIAKPIIPDRSSKPKFDSFMHNNLKNNNDVTIKDDDIDSDSDMPSPSNNNTSEFLNNLDKVANKKSVTDRSEFPPKPNYLLSSTNSVTNGHSKNLMDTNGYAKLDKLSDNGDKSMDISDDDDLVAGNFDDLNQSSREPPSPSVLQTPVHRRNEPKFSLDDKMSEEEEESEVQPSRASRSKPISMNRPNGTVNYSAPSSLSRSLSSPNIAQFDQESQEFSFNSVGGGTPKFSQALPHIDRTVKPLPYQALRKHRDFSPQFSSVAHRPTGLRNLGNTCFMNSILQCLNNTTELSDYLRSGNVQINPNSKFGSNGELTIELMELFKQMDYPSNYKHISPRDMKGAVIRHIPDFVEYKQQDAHEFLVRFLDRVHADLNMRANAQVLDPVTKDPNYYDKLSITSAANRFWGLHSERNKSIITDLFEGLIVSSLKCLHCDHTSKALEAFTCLTLPIQEGGRTSIGTSLKMFLKRERITDEAAWQCPTCNQKRDAEKCTFIWRLPKILVIHLKRFSYDGMWRQKINTFVDFPIDNLLLEARDGQLNQSYNLYGVVNHTGSLEGGHYIAYSRNLEHNIPWQRYDDQDVSPVPVSEVITQNAYVLFYKQTKTSSV